MTPVHTATAILLIPLISAAIIAIFLRRRGAWAATVSVVAAGLLAVLSLGLIFGGERFTASMPWLQVGGLTITMGFKFDDLAALMLFVVSFVGFFIHLFSVGYMRDDAARGRYFGGLSLFMFAMLGIVFSSSLFMMFIFWELVGFSSYMLIGHYDTKQSAADAGKKAFVTNRVGDFAFLLGIIYCYWVYGTTDLAAIDATVTAGGLAYSRLVPLLLFCGAVGKSAQIPLHVWLPDAMEGPTPVSALIHAATMVAAGVYMLCRIQVLMVPEASTVIMWVGTITALYAALCAIVQSDIKKVLAYSTLSQLGYMVAAFGLGSLAVAHGHVVGGVLITAGVAAAMFHLTTHGFFKALLFLGSGSVIAACHHEQDIFKMGGLAKRMPVTFITFTVAVAAICGVPFFSGFYSKDAILLLALERDKAVFVILAFTVVLTAFYMIRMWKLAFLGTSRSEATGHAKESGLVMTLPLIVLGILALIGGYAGVFDRLAGSVAGGLPHAAGGAHETVAITGIILLLVGVAGAWLLYRNAGEDAMQAKAPAVYRGLTALRWSFDTLYTWYIDKIQQRFAMLLNFLEQIFLAGLIIRGLAGLVGLLGLGARALHVGNLHAYVYWFLLGLLLLWVLTSGVFILS